MTPSESETRAVAPCITEPYRLWSLEDLMKQLKASAFANISSVSAQLSSLNVGPGAREAIADAMKPEAIEMLQMFLDHMRELGLFASAASLDRILGMVTDHEVQELAPVIREFADLRSRIQDELGGRLCFAIDPEHQKFWVESHPFGEVVSDRFPSAITDTIEAGRCLGTGRATAAVFHLMRVMEFGLRAVGQSLNDETIDPDRNPTWNTMLTRFDSELKKNVQNRSPQWREDDAFFAGIAARLHAVKDAWRNPTMHVRGTYTIEEATDIFNNVRGFMQHLSRRLNESAV